MEFIDVDDLRMYAEEANNKKSQIKMNKTTLKYIKKMEKKLIKRAKAGYYSYENRSYRWSVFEIKTNLVIQYFRKSGIKTEMICSAGGIEDGSYDYRIYFEWYAK